MENAHMHLHALDDIPMAAVSDRPKFEFISYNSSSEKERKLASKRVKKHVMYDYFRRRHRLDRTNSVSILKGKRATQVGQVSSLSQTHRQTGISRVSDSHDPYFSSLNPAKVNLTSAVDRIRASGATAGLVDFKDLKSSAFWTPEQAGWSINAHPGPYRIDPFDTLPITDVPDDLIHWHFALHSCQQMSPWMHAANAGWVQRKWSGATQDPVLLCILLSQAEWNHMMVARVTDPTRYLLYKGQALRILRQQIAAADKEISDSLILSVVAHALHAADGSLAASRKHLKAAFELADRKKTRLQGDALVYLLAADAKVATTHMTRPVLDVESMLPPIPAPPSLSNLLQLYTTASLQTLPSDFPLAGKSVIWGLHWTTRTCDTASGPFVEWPKEMANFTRNVSLLSRLVVDACKKDDMDMPNSIRPTTAIIITLEFFAWILAQGKSPWKFGSPFARPLASTLLPRLRRLIDPNKGDSPMKCWKASNTNLVSLLWVSFIGSIMAWICNDEETSLELLKSLKAVARNLLLFDLLGFQKTLRILPWSDIFCEEWSRIMAGRMGLLGAEEQEYGEDNVVVASHEASGAHMCCPAHARQQLDFPYERGDLEA